MEPWIVWKDRIEELDACSFDTTKWETEFLASLLERQPNTLSSAQVDVLEQMCRKYGIA